MLIIVYEINSHDEQWSIDNNIQDNDQDKQNCPHH
jgi:hypothetical protein